MTVKNNSAYLRILNLSACAGTIVITAFLSLAVAQDSLTELPAQISSIEADSSGWDPSPEELEAYYRNAVKPLLAKSCYACHGALKQESDLRLDTAKAMTDSSTSSSVVIAGDPDSSELILRVTAKDGDERMPPMHEGEAFNSAEVEILRNWILHGAVAPEDEQPESDPKDHWAFQPCVRPDIPCVNDSWIRNPVDAFIAMGHQRMGIQPQPEAPRELLIRRLYVNLIGLPPTPDELERCLTASDESWYAELVEQLLDHPGYGERWGRHWMDVWRFSDWWGLGDQLRNSQKNIWHWRDWIVESINADLGYDEMIRQMLAADELYPSDISKLRAGGYLARNYFLFNRHQWMDETVEHVGKGFLGLTVNCAKCHDHKYDPITQVDYYRMRAIFEPYHVRTDMHPEHPSIDGYGVPRAFDGCLDVPTYFFVRGQENQPDESVSIEAGVPAGISDLPFVVSEVSLPDEAWQPERRAWVYDLIRSQAASHLDESQQAMETVSVEDQLLHQAEVEIRAADLRRIELVYAAMQADWIVQQLTSQADSMPVDELESAQASFRIAANQAAEAEIEHQQAVLSKSILIAERDWLTADEAKVTELATKLQELNSQLEQLTNELQRSGAGGSEKPVAFQSLEGAKWSATRFQFSGHDDPRVSFPEISTGRRTALAGWIIDRQNPLTARVAVNQIWMRHFGEPLVPTVFDFGRKGVPPKHPELLDWLACEFMDSGWSMKHIHRLIVHSATYRLSSSTAGAEDAMAVDPDNQFWWRRMPIRIESQVLRDLMLEHAGVLDATIGGPSVEMSAQSTSRRRSIYFFHSNNERNRFLDTFDDAMVSDCYRREQSIVPQQALAMTNSLLVREIAPLIAQQMMSRCSSESDFVQRSFVELLGYQASEAELTACIRALDRLRSAFQAEDGNYKDGRITAHLIWSLLNHNDFVTLR